MAKMAAVGVGLFSGSFAFPALTATLAFGYVTKQRITKFKDNTLTHLRMVDLIKDRFIRPLVDQLELDLGPDLEMGLFDSPKRAVLNEIQDRLPVDLDLLLRISDPSDEVSKIVKECLFERFGIHSLRLPDYQPSPVRTETATRFIQGLKDISPVLSRLSSIKTDWKHELSSFAKGTAYQAIIYLLWMRC
ncbi:MAG: hypothetical protein JSS32_05865 [Verrucomicrobia bacterium]|nr:hypothetical protein [Verrucomicrobiota bacterium]